MQKENDPFSPQIKRTFEGQQIVQVNEKVTVGKIIERRELIYPITVWGETIYLKPQTAKRVAISLMKLLNDNDLDNVLKELLKPRVISMNEYMKKQPETCLKM